MGPKALGLPPTLPQDQTQVHQPIEGIPDLPLREGKHRIPVPQQPDKVRRSQTGPWGAIDDPTGPTTILGNDPNPEGNLLVADGLQQGQSRDARCVRAYRGNHAKTTHPQAGMKG